ncbi:MAG: flavodoxin-dependent (E)-4-hydroxy-3-methylbut-2-enyl-diphosphate synthase, partial [Planctomycetota bacterium]
CGGLTLEGRADAARVERVGDGSAALGAVIFGVEDGLELLYTLGLRERKGAELIACPTCGRIQVDLFTLVQDVRKVLADDIELPIKVAVMGCVVNGPGEAEGADVAVFAGDRRGIIYVQ